MASAASPSGVSGADAYLDHHGAIEPLHLLASLTAGVLLIVLARGPIRDIDVWWHRAIGEEIWRRGSVFDLGNAWAPFGDQDWFTTQWLSELGFYLAHLLGGWQAVLLIRVSVSAILLAALAAALLPRRPARAAVPVFVLAAMGLMPALTQDRVQTLGILLAIPLGVWVAQGVHGRFPPWWQVALLGVVWANVHGSWVLLPAVLVLLSGACLLDCARRRTWRRPLVLASIALLGGLVSPTAWLSLAAVWQFTDRTKHVTEWAPTVFSEATVLPFVMLVALLLFAWARSRPVPWAELAVAGGLIAFSALAFRNVLFALVLLAPLIADRLSLSVRPRPAIGIEARVLTLLSLCTFIVCIAVALVLASNTDPTADAAPLRIARFLAQVDGPKRILNDYNAAGVLLEFGGAGVELGIDGRADRYSSDYTDRYLGAQARLIDWEQVLAEVEPNYAVLRVDNALPTMLDRLGWRTLMQDGHYVLMRRPEYIG